MGTISDKLMRIINTKEDIRQALISKGYDVPTSIPFKEYAKMISDLPCRVDSFPDIEGIVARYSALGLTNEQMKENPVWVDKTGNGHDLQMKNFLWGGMSGVGGYVENFNDFRTGIPVEQLIVDEQNSSLIKISVLVPGINNSIYIPKDRYQFGKSYYLRVSSEGYNEGDLSFLLYATDVSTATSIRIPLNPNGITEIPAVQEDDYQAAYITVGGKMGSLTIEQLPLYPGALVFDGVDDYGVCDNFPILTKEKGYTVVALRRWIEEKNDSAALVSNCKNWNQDGAFLFEYNNLRINVLNESISFGRVSIVDREKSPFSYQTSKLYNGKNIGPGSFIGSNELVVGKGSKGFPSVSKVAIWEIVILDHDATEEELTKIKDYFVKTYPWLFPDQAWTVVGKTNEDEDRATIANITGNGDDLVLSNFGFIEGSGYNEEGECAGYLVTDGMDDCVRSSNDFTLGKKFTVVGEWELLDNTTVLSGIAKNADFFLYSNINGLSFYCKQGNLPAVFNGIKSLTAFNSEGLAYDHKWEKYVCEKTDDEAPKTTRFIIGTNNNTFAKVAFKNMAMYAEKVLSKEDMIKAYNYLQTLKSK